MNPGTSPMIGRKVTVTGRRITRLIEGGATEDGQTAYISMELDHAGSTTLIVELAQMRQLIHVLECITDSTGHYSRSAVEYTIDEPARIREVSLDTDGDDGLLMFMTTDEQATIVAQLPVDLVSKLATGIPGALFRISEERLGNAPSAALH